MPKMRLKLLQKKQFKRTAGAIGDLSGNKKLLIKSQTFKTNNTIIQRQLQVRMTKKYLTKWLKKIYISRRKTGNYWWTKINIML